MRRSAQDDDSVGVSRKTSETSSADGCVEQGYRVSGENKVSQKRYKVQMKRLATLFLLGCSLALAYSTAITPNVSAVKTGSIAVVSSAQSLKITWDDTANQHWQTIFSLDSTKPLITAISVDGRNIVELAKPTIDVPPESAVVDGTPSLTSLRLTRRELGNSCSSFIRPQSLPRRWGIEWK